MVGRRNTLIVGVLLVGCARAMPSEEPSTEGPLLGEPCALSSTPQGSSPPPRVFVELATLQGDLPLVQEGTAPAGEGPVKHRTFSQMLAQHPWRAVSVRNVIAPDGVGQTFPWDFDPPDGSTGCPASEGWELHMTPHVAGRSPLMVHLEVQILPAPPPGVTPDAWHVPPSCGARTTLVARDQQLVVLSGFPQPERGEPVTTVTPYVIWEDTDLQRLAECKRKSKDVDAGLDSTAPSPTHGDQ